MAKFACSVTGGPTISAGKTFFNRPVNLSFVRSISVGSDENEQFYYIEFDGIDVRWLFNTAEQMEEVYGHIIQHEF